ncbi:ferritin-like domain-containing protein [Pseudomonas sp. NPDC090201]|uniref:ferritin-like domain-containing protein n=1 Tax=Pseudomonas sp. NPDC090201 TaxID=3364475 RepID=UPI00380C20C2
MFADVDPKPGLNAEFAADAHGLYTTLHGQERELFLQLLDAHRETAEQAGGFAREVRWRLRSLNYQAIKELFKDLDQSTREFVTFLESRMQMLNGTVTQARLTAAPLADAEQAPGFRECFKEIHQLAQHLTTLTAQAQGFMDRAVDAGDYATANLVSELLYRTNQLVCKIKLDIPSGASFTSECRQPPRPNTWFSTMEVWAHSPGIAAFTTAQSYRF